MRLVISSLERGKRELSSGRFRGEIDIQLSDHYFIIDHRHENWREIYNSKEYIVRENGENLIILPREFLNELVEALGKNRNRAKIRKVTAETLGKIPEKSEESWAPERELDFFELEDSNLIKRGIKRLSEFFNSSRKEKKAESIKTGVGEERKIFVFLIIALIQITALVTIIHLEKSEHKRYELIKGESEELTAKIEEFEKKYGELQEIKNSILRDKNMGVAQNIESSDEIWYLGESSVFRGITLDRIMVEGESMDISGKSEELTDIYNFERELSAKGFIGINSDFVKSENGIYLFRLDMTRGKNIGNQ